jgi:putative spermidine/putrescine transport system substrate-binding protein
MKKKPELGIKNPYELTPTNMPLRLPCFRRRGAGRPLLARRHGAGRRLQERRRRRLLVMAVPGQSSGADKKPVASTIPEEGATGWADTTMMHVDAKHPNCAYKWLEHSLSPKLQGDLASWFGSVPTVPPPAKATSF